MLSDCMGFSGAKHQSVSAIKTNSELLVRHKMRKVMQERSGRQRLLTLLVSRLENCGYFRGITLASAKESAETSHYIRFFESEVALLL
jgi:hypothetical protein